MCPSVHEGERRGSTSPPPSQTTTSSGWALEIAIDEQEYNILANLREPAATSWRVEIANGRAYTTPLQSSSINVARAFWEEKKNSSSGVDRIAHSTPSWPSSPSSFPNPHHAQLGFRSPPFCVALPPPHRPLLVAAGTSPSCSRSPSSLPCCGERRRSRASSVCFPQSAAQRETHGTYPSYSRSSSSSPCCGERHRPRAPRKSCKAWLLQSIPTEMPHLHHLPVVLSIECTWSLENQGSERMGAWHHDRRKTLGVSASCSALICVKNAPNLPAKNFHALTRWDENRAKCQLALKAGVYCSPRTTYSQLLDTVWQLVNYAKSVRVEKGDAVVIYLSMLMELPIAMLACSRIGPVHSVVFAGFSADAIAHRITECKPKVVITCNAVKRGLKLVPLKDIIDAALVESAKNDVTVGYS
ncbi:hypothetical protein ZWY2020_018662 [Hordeum vulgare]|nr:hypothetical protein ZWY2020_018662 [Hordeum vulgare]